MDRVSDTAPMCQAGRQGDSVRLSLCKSPHLPGPEGSGLGPDGAAGPRLGGGVDSQWELPHGKEDAVWAEILIFKEKT